jgi:hypothetical protein
MTGRPWAGPEELAERKWPSDRGHRAKGTKTRRRGHDYVGHARLRRF